MKYLLLALLFAQPAPPTFDPAPSPIVRQVVPDMGQMGEVEVVEYLAPLLFKDPEVEYALPDGRRVDVLTDDYAYEADWSYKWTEGIGQALSYAIATNRKPGLIFLMKGADDERYNQCLAVITNLRSRGYPFRFIVVNVENGKRWEH